MNPSIPLKNRYSKDYLIFGENGTKIRKARFCVVGGGALGNSVIKNLAMHGVASLCVVDMEEVEESNLALCFLFTREDAMRRNKKAEACREAVKRINSDVRCTSLAADARRLEGEFFREFDIVLGCVDSVSSRLHLNSACYSEGIPYVDAGVSSFRGRIQSVRPPSPCYQCTVNSTHLQEVDAEWRCNGTGATLPARQTITTPEVSGIVASIQVSEALRLITDIEMKGRLILYSGLDYTAEIIQLERNAACDLHG